MSTTFSSAAQLLAAEGMDLGRTDWLLLTQERINLFAEATGDHQWIHVDEEKAKQMMGSTIAHGFLTLSLQVSLRGLVDADKPLAVGVRNVINYGLNKLRFPNAVRVNSRIRGRFTLLAVEQVAPNVLQVTEQYTAEIEGAARPACVAESMMRLVF